MGYLEIIKAKILNKEELGRFLSICRFQKKKVVFTNGCFDLLHLGHIEYLAKAKDLGDRLVIGLNTDASIRRIKGESRPVTEESSRSLALAALQFVDAVVFFEEDTPKELIEFVKPDILIKGSDYKEKDIVGYSTVKNSGGEIKTIDLVPGYSTSNIIDKIKNS